MESPARIGPFLLGATAGIGGMGRVWRGTHESTGLPVAVKALTAQRARDPRFGRAFRHEVRAVAALDHPRIIAIFDYGEAPDPCDVPDLHPGTPWFVMEWAAGGSLFHQLPLVQWSAVVEVLDALLEALAHAHARGVLHRDLKPGNVLHCPGEGWKLADFGIARTGADPALADSGLGPAAGTPLYMAPEQARGAWRDQGPWTDLYALGCLAWELVTGVPPFVGDGVRSQHVLAPLPAFTPILDVPPGVEQWLHNLLAKRRTVRFAFAADARIALQGLDGTPRGGRPLAGRERMAPSSTEAIPPTTEIESSGTFDEPPAAADPALPHAPVPAAWSEPARTLYLPTNAGLGLLALRPVPLVDRDEERDRLWAHLVEVARSGRAQVVRIEGPSGAGKTRLAEWLCLGAHECGAADFLRATHAPQDGPADGLDAALVRHLALMDLSVAAAADRLADLGLHLDGEDATAVAALLSGAGPKRERAAVLRTVCAGLARNRPLVVWIDDAQWGIDDLAVIRHVLDAEVVEPLSILFVLTVQSEALVGHPQTAALLDAIAPAPLGIEVLPLGEADQDALIQRILGLDPALAATVRDRTAGNPLFAVQLVRAWNQRGDLIPGPFGFRLAGSTVVPAALGDVWRQRLDDLMFDVEPAGVHAIELAAVLGHTVDGRSWRDACHLARIDPRPDLVERLLQARLALARGHDAWSFTHGMFRESLLARARTGGRLAFWHAVCARLLDQIGGSAEQIGAHRLAAGDADGACAPLVQAARTRRRNGDLALATAVVEDAERALRTASVTASDPRWGEVASERLECLRLRGELDAAERLASETLARARIHGWKPTRCQVLFNRAEIARAQGRFDDAVMLAEEAVVAARSLGDSRLVATALASLGAALREKREPERALAVVEEAWRISQTFPEPYLRAQAALFMTLPLQDLERWEEAEGHARTADALALEHGLRLLRGPALTAIGGVRRAGGDLVGAEAAYREAAREFARCGHAHTVLAELNVAYCLHLQGRPDDAHVILSRWEHAPGRRQAQALSAFYEVLAAAVAAAQAQWSACADRLGAAEALCRKTNTWEVDFAALIAGAGEQAAMAGLRPLAERAWRFAEHNYRACGKPIQADSLASRAR